MKTLPSLPGYGFSPGPRHTGVSSRGIGKLWHGLMSKLEYDRFCAQGGDIGAGVSMWLGRLYPENVCGIHWNDILGPFRPSLDGGANATTDDERAFLERVGAWIAAEGANANVHSAKPQILSFALTDSSVGLAAWVVEKFSSWSDCAGNIENAIPLDALLTDMSLHRFDNSLAASLRLYKEDRRDPLTFASAERAVPPLGAALFPRELPMPPRPSMERVFGVTRWSVMPKGGHFAALERPDLLAEEIRTFFRPLRSAS